LRFQRLSNRLLLLIFLSLTIPFILYCDSNGLVGVGFGGDVGNLTIDLDESIDKKVDVSGIGGAGWMRLALLFP